jgi:hypothetical protein
MKERHIPFKGAMVRAILDGTKTQTRRLCKHKVYPNGFHFDGHDILCHNDYLPPSAMLMDVKRGKHSYTTSDVEGWINECPYGLPGDRLWVREAWRTADTLDSMSPTAIGDAAISAGYKVPWAPLQFEADGVRNGAWAGFGPGNGVVVGPGRLRAGMHMPRWASRITLEVTDVRVERLQDISEADAIAEGIENDPRLDPAGTCHWRVYGAAQSTGTNLPERSYESLWTSINGPGSWDLNPWVWVVSFRRLP